jgi:diguanylate cyclase (GGDEF)-like protein
LRTSIETEPDCIKVIGSNGKLLEMNAAGSAMLGADSLAEVQQQDLIGFITPEYRDSFVFLHQRVINGENGKLEFEVTGLKDTQRWLESHAAPLQDADGKQMALMVLDLDRFNTVNDSFGHGTGDELLKQVAERLISRSRDVDKVARLGGDEFIVLLDDITHQKDLARIADTIIADLGKPFQLTQCNDVEIGVSIGIRLFPQHGENPEILMDHADTAFYKPKDKGRGSFAYFSEDMTHVVRKRIELDARLRKAFKEPQVDIVTGCIIGAEALVRWQDQT